MLGPVLGVALLCGGRASRHYARIVDSDSFVLQRRHIASGLRTWAATFFGMALIIAVAPVIEWHYRVAKTARISSEDAQLRLALADAWLHLSQTQQRLDQATQKLSVAGSPGSSPGGGTQPASVGTKTLSPNTFGNPIRIGGAASILLRDAPGGRVIGKLPNGSAVEVNGEPPVPVAGNNWISVRTNQGSRGWVAQRFFESAPMTAALVSKDQ